MDNNTPQPTPIAPATSPRTYLLAAALLLIPALIGLGVVAAVRRAKPVAPPPPYAADATNALIGAAAPQLSDLTALRRELRCAGQDTEAVNVKIWAAHAYTPTALFHVAPPEGGKRWTWHLSQDGRFAVAVAAQADSAPRRAVGLFDLITDEWVWKKELPWPDEHEAPYVFNRHLVVRYTKNAQRFAMEIDAGGAIAGIDSLGKSAFQPSAPQAPVPGFPGTPVALRSGVLFTAAPDQTLSGYALEKLPGLRYAGKGNLSTVFSGNGLLKFTVQDGIVTVADSLTQTVLQRVAAWNHTPNTAVTGTLVTPDGSQLSIFLRTTFPGTPPQSREWSVSLATYTGTVKPSFSADALLAKPKIDLQKQALSSDGRWRVSVSPSNGLAFAAMPEGREIASVKLDALLGARAPIDHIAFLEEGRQLLIRQGDAFWLLDFAAVRGQADLLARVAACEKYVPMPAPAPAGEKAGLPAPATPSPLVPASSNELACAFLALRGEWFVSHQAWGYAAASFEEAATRSASDGRAPRVSPLLLARAQILAGQMPKARRVCREALMKLLTDPSLYNRMARYALQGILFSQSQETAAEPQAAAPAPADKPAAKPAAAKPAAKPAPHREAKTHAHKSAPLDTPHRSR